MTKAIVGTLYKKFGYFLMFLLVLGMVFNGFSSISTWIAAPIIGLLVGIEMTVAVVVEFNDDEETFWTKFLSRFMRLDVLGACLAIIMYIGVCNNWLDAM